MNQDHENHETEVIDPQVAAHYVLIADESTPPELDRAVMHNARNAVLADDRRGPFATWFRPAAFVATAGLSLAIVIGLSNTSDIPPLAVNSPQGRQPVAVRPIVEATPDIAPRKRTAADATDALRREKSTLAPLSKMAAPDAASDENGLSLRALPTESSFDQSPARTANAMADFAAEALQGCRDDMTPRVEDWWKCIANLRQAGMTEIAASQLKLLTREYPDFKPPEADRGAQAAGTRRTVPE